MSVHDLPMRLQHPKEETPLGIANLIRTGHGAMRMTPLIFSFLLCLLVLSAAAGAQKCAISPARLRTEYAEDPIAVKGVKPRFFWTVESKQRGQFQAAFQILVAATPERLANDKGDLWDSTRIESDACAHIEYAGRALRSRQQAWWKVRVWDSEGKMSAWSKPATFEIGLQSNDDWKAHWISMKGGDMPDFSLKKAFWIWTNEQDAQGNAPSGGRLFRYDFMVPVDKKVKDAMLIAAADDAFTAFVNGQQVSTGNSFTTVKAADVAKQVKPGRNILGIIGNNGQGPAALAAMLRIRYSDGTEYVTVTDSTWLAAIDSSKDWNTAALPTEGFGAAKVLGSVGAAPWGDPKYALEGGPSPLLRKEFDVDRKVRKARAHVSALGLYEFHLDGKKVGDAYFTPGWTDYSRRIQYQTYDVTAQLQEGPHAIGLILGDGWYCGNVCWFGRNLYGPKPRGLVQLEIEYDDATHETIVSDATWRVTDGPIRLSDTLMGEEYDARKDMPGWALAGFNDLTWEPAETAPIGDVPFEPQSEALVKKVAELKPKTFWKTDKGAVIYDLGQNMVGWARLKVKGPKGTKITLRFAEVLNPDKTIYTTNLRSAKQTDHYTLSGDGLEVFEPHFTFHGFRYVEVTGYPGEPGKDAVTGIVLSSANMPTGTFETSNKMVNQLQHNIVWGMMGNYLEVPTDCPQRDERLGWMGDAQVFIRTGCFNFDIAPFMTKWVQDVREAQSPQGAYRDVSPNALGANNSGSPAWGDAGIIVPWTIFRCYGDKRILADHYDSMKKWINYLSEANPDHIWVNRSGANYGDWLSIQADTPKEVLATAYFAYSTQLLSKIAYVLDDAQGAAKYGQLFEKIKQAFNAKFVKPDGRIHGDTQTCYVLALRFDLLPEALKPRAEQYLLEDIAKRKGLLSTGFVGTGILAPTLSQFGHHDAAYKLLLNDEFPSWGYTIKHGATTIWERWDGWTDTKGFQDAGMNSFNHYAFGAIGEWMYSRVAGIDLYGDVPAYKAITIAPIVGGGLTWAKGSLDTLYGKVSSSWKVDNGKILLEVQVPTNAMAYVVVPTSEPSSVREGGKKLRVLQHADPSNLPMPFILAQTPGKAATVLVGGGTYRFEAKR